MKVVTNFKPLGDVRLQAGEALAESAARPSGKEPFVRMRCVIVHYHEIALKRGT